MLEANLVASRAAVGHILATLGFPEGDSLYGPSPERDGEGGASPWPGQAAECKLVRTAYDVERRLDRRWGSEPDDEMPRIRDFVRSLPEPRRRAPLWPHARGLIAECLSRRASAGAAALYAEAVGRAVDERFFALAGQVPRTATAATRDARAVHDSHIHLGGAVPWDDQWCWLMTQRYPLHFFSRAKTRLVRADEFVALLKKAMELRRTLAERFGPMDRLGEPDFEPLLYRRLHGLGERELNDDEVRDYVLIRSLARREMLIGDVASLNEFTGDAWKRFWGKKKKRAGRLRGGHWTALLKRMERVETDKLVVALGRLRADSVGATLRTNLDWPPNRAGVQLARAREVLGTKERLVIHGSRPDGVDLTANHFEPAPVGGEWKDLDPDRRTWKAQVKTLGTVDADHQSVAALDLAGPERDSPLLWFEDAVRKVFSFDRGVTVHVGEDFHDPWQGLARVEAVLRLWKKDNETNKELLRIGHGSVLGVNPYALKWGRVLDCPLWARREGLSQAMELAVNAEAAHFLCRALHGELEALPTVSVRDAIRLRVPMKASEEEKQAFRVVQRWLTEELKNDRVVVESNPTSNLRVLGVPGYAWVPFWGLYGSGLKVALGTDNPGLLNTFIEDEYARLRMAFEDRICLEKRHGEDMGPAIWRHAGEPTTPKIQAKWREIESRTRACTQRCATFGV